MGDVRVKVAAIVSGLLLVGGCYSITDGPDAPPAEPLPAGTTMDDAPRPAVVERVDLPYATGSTARSRKLKAVLVAFVKETHPELTIAEARDDASAESSYAGVLIKAGDGYGSISAQLTEPVITSGEAACMPDTDHVCFTRPMRGGTVVVTGTEDTGGAVAEWHLPDLDVPFFVMADEQVNREDALFWHGGPSAPRIPLSPDELALLAERVHAELAT